ncbi:uncharacterized protein LOC116213774 [Punica granatum]|uniref:Protein POLAR LOCALIZATION DURING ASYMMETRIC DIVISION AND REDISTRIBUTION n=2 Tax=Punica granatum TaxID=22663 RepID=A0A218VZB9_PUNGR|nr:uncharacterized protein LOC116213774 [Punica granatum]OWM65232.1 hypothetical protein CDL15_Pgr008822 [Punica granatum]PKI47740.1 hypothetical protein CRG98_031873 [Punica granatum]
MDFWVFVAAAGAGCLAKRLQSTSMYKDGLSKLSYEASSSGDHELHNYPARRLAHRNKLEKDASKNVLNEQIFDISHSNCSPAADWGSPSGIDDQTSARDLRECNESSGASLPADFPMEQTETGDENRINNDSNNCDSSEVFSAEPAGGGMATFHGYAKHGRCLRSRYLQEIYLKPQSSLESCLMAQLYNHHAEMVDFSHHPLTPATSLNIRPLLVPDESSRISRLADPSSRQAGAEVKKSHKKVYPDRRRAVLGVPPLPTVGCSKMPKQVHNRSGKGKDLVGSSRMTNGKKIHSRNGTPAGTTLLCFGISLGIIFSVVANKKEVDKLKELLKQTENLVQDLQEELEMRDSMTVKELASENYESLDTRNNSIHGTAPSIFSPEHCIENPNMYNGKASYIETAGKSPDSMTRIEAELEAELERLGLNLKAANLGRKLSDAELDPDFAAGFAGGEFRAEGDFSLKDANCQDSSNTSTTHSVNYAVSPRELSLRLHEVIQSRLEGRIEELELALQNSQRKVQLLESSASKSRRRSPLIKDLQLPDPHQSFPKPFVMSLSGEALTAYREAYEELVKFESEEDDSPSGLSEGQHREFSETEQSTAQEIDHVYAVGYESSDADDEKEKLLIKQIIERTKKGSPVVVNALLSIDEVGE